MFYRRTCALTSSLSGRGTLLGDSVRVTVIEEASNGASSVDDTCLMPASVRAEAVLVVGVDVPDGVDLPDDAGEIAIGAIVYCISSR